MMPAGKCPKCGNVVSVLYAHTLTANLGGASYKAISYQCPNAVCQAVLGCQIDPIAIKTDIVNEIVNLLRKP
jgi:hypothetical protein